MAARRTPWLVTPIVLALVLSLPALADELRSDEQGLTIKVPDGWARTAANGPLFVLAHKDPAAPRIAVNVQRRETTTEEKAYKEPSVVTGKQGELVERPSGRFYRIELDPQGDGPELRRLYATFREKRLYYFLLNTTRAGFAKDSAALDEVVDTASFFAPVQPATPTAEPSAAPTASATPPPAKPDPPRPTETKPPVKPDPGSPFVHTPERHDPPPDVAPIATPAAPRGTRRASQQNLLTPSSLVSFDSEYSSEVGSAKRLVDGSTATGWCSAPGAQAPHRFVFELAKAVDVARLSLDAVTSDEKGFEGAAAKDVTVEGSTLGPYGPWRELGRGSLERGKNDQSVDLPQNEVRWLRFSITANYGHPTLTQLMEARAYAAEWVTAVPAPREPPQGGPVRTTHEGAFRLERAKLSHERTGAAVDPAVFAPGEIFWVYFKPCALRLDEKGEYALEVDLKVEDRDGHERDSKPKIVENVPRKPPSPPYSPFVSLRVELPQDFPTGVYTVRVVARDTLAKKEVVERLAFEVKKPR